MADHNTIWAAMVGGGKAMTAARVRWVEQALLEAREEGRRAGLEEAATECDSIADDWFQAKEDNESVLACQVAGDCAETIRARIGQPPCEVDKPQPSE